MRNRRIGEGSAQLGIHIVDPELLRDLG